MPDEESAALPIGTVERISSLQSGYNTTSQEAILSTVARDLEMRSGRIIQLKDREQIGQPVPEPVQRSARNGDFQREADAMAVALANAFPPEAVVPAPTEHYTPRMKLTCWQADKLAAEFLHSRRPERLHWNVCEPPSLLPSQPPSLSLPTFNPDIHPAYAAPPPPAFNPDIHAAYAAPPMEVEKLQPAAPKVFHCVFFFCELRMRAHTKHPALERNLRGRAVQSMRVYSGVGANGASNHAYMCAARALLPTRRLLPCWTANLMHHR